MSNKNEKLTPKKRRKNKFSRAFRQFFGCTLKNVETIKTVSVSCQCQIENDLETISYTKEDAAIRENKDSLDNGEGPSPSLSQDFKSSLKKLDSLISTLNNIHDVYKTSTSLQCYNGETTLNKETEDDVLQFNINFDKNTFIECQTMKGKRSLKIIHNSGEQNFSPLILHRCESELLVKTVSCDNLTIKSSSEAFLDKIDHTLIGKFGPIYAYDFTPFKKNLVDHMKNIRNEVRTLKGILCHVEYMSRDLSAPPLSFGDMTRRWILARSEENICTRYEEESIVQGYRYLEARTRATNFCRFYMMERRQKKKIKSRNVSKTKIK